MVLAPGHQGNGGGRRRRGWMDGTRGGLDCSLVVGRVHLSVSSTVHGRACSEGNLKNMMALRTCATRCAYSMGRDRLCPPLSPPSKLTSTLEMPASVKSLASFPFFPASLVRATVAPAPDPHMHDNVRNMDNEDREPTMTNTYRESARYVGWLNGKPHYSIGTQPCSSYYYSSVITRVPCLCGFYSP